MKVLNDIIKDYVREFAYYDIKKEIAFRLFGVKKDKNEVYDSELSEDELFERLVDSYNWVTDPNKYKPVLSQIELRQLYDNHQDESIDLLLNYVETTGKDEILPVISGGTKLSAKEATAFYAVKGFVIGLANYAVDIILNDIGIINKATSLEKIINYLVSK